MLFHIFAFFASSSFFHFEEINFILNTSYWPVIKDQPQLWSMTSIYFVGKLPKSYENLTSTVDVILSQNIHSSPNCRSIANNFFPALLISRVLFHYK
jgi:hypothetical protein